MHNVIGDESDPPRTRYLLFLDECGTHDMQHVDPQFPVFLLMGLLVGELYYARTLVPKIKHLKQEYLPANPNAVLHSRDIRRCQGDFAFLRQSQVQKSSFYDAISGLFASSRIKLFAIAVDKQRLLQHSLVPFNPYNVSLSQLLSAVIGPPRVVGPSRPTVCRITAESRGGNEDKELQSEYQELRRCGLANYGAPGCRPADPVQCRIYSPTESSLDESHRPLPDSNWLIWPHTRSHEP